VGAGLAAGAVVAGYKARNLDQQHLLLEVVGGGIGGMLGAIAPDFLEPALHSWHRSVAHSGAAGFGGAFAIQQCATWQQRCRLEAQRHDQLRAITQDDWARFWHAAMAFLWRLLSGFVAGLPAGYLLHLILDAASPRGIPPLVGPYWLPREPPGCAAPEFALDRSMGSNCLAPASPTWDWARPSI